jgi:SAM-dependent methyltransferase
MLNDDVVFLPNQLGFWRVFLSNLEEEKVGAVNPCSNFVAGGQSLMQIDTSSLFNSDILIGFCLAIKTKVLKDLGGLDPALPGGDDLDLSIRLKKAGYNLRVDKRCYLHHFGQQTGSRIYKDHWDSSWHQELTNNALIKKHGVELWYDCFCGTWSNVKEKEDKLKNSSENLWLEKVTGSFKGEPGLNIGCGDKKIEGALGVDVNDTVGDAGGQQGKESKAELIADAADIPCADSSQSYIVATHILEHTINVLRTMKEWFRLLRENGMLFLSVPNHDKLSTMLIDYTHVHAFNKDSLQNLIETCGFKIENIEEDEAGAIRVEARKVIA